MYVYLMPYAPGNLKSFLKKKIFLFLMKKINLNSSLLNILKKHFPQHLLPTPNPLTMSDDVIWKILDEQFCSFKITTGKNENFCRNEYNVSGICSRETCPLANARYATVRNVKGRLYLYMKTAERVHTPKKWWERVRLSKRYSKALAQIDESLVYWPEFLKHKCKQRLTRLTQVALAEQRLALAKQQGEIETTTVAIAPKVKRREKIRERKALAAAKIEKAIEKELLERLKSGAYGAQPLNVDEKVWQKVMENMKGKQEAENEEEDEDEEEYEDEEEEDDNGELEYVEDDDEEEIVDLENLEKWLGSSDDDDEEDDQPSSDSDISSDSEDEESDNDDKSTKKRKSKSKDSEQQQKKKKLTKQKKAKRGGPSIEVEYENETSLPVAN